MATMTVKRSAMDAIYTALAGITAANGYSTTIGTARRHIFGREDARGYGPLPIVGFMIGRSVPTPWEGFGEARVVAPVSVTAVVEATSWTTGVDALDKLEDDLIQALMADSVRDAASITSLIWTGSEDDTGSPDTFDSRGGTMAMVITFDLVYRRARVKTIT